MVHIDVKYSTVQIGMLDTHTQRAVVNAEVKRKRNFRSEESLG